MAPPLDPPGDIPELFAIERVRLLSLLATVSEPDWLKPTPCPAWTILGLSCHLLGDDFSLLSRNRDHYLGTPAPDAAGDKEFVEWLDNLQIEWVQAARRLSPRLVVDLLAWTSPQLVDVLRNQDGRARTAQVWWAGPDAVPVWLDQLRELSEYWIHRQQLLEALDQPPDLRSELAGPLLDGLRWAYPYRLGQVRAEPGDTVKILIGGPVSATWHLVSTEAGWDFRSQPGPRLVATLSMTTDEAWRLLTNNLPADDNARLELTGEPAVVDVIRRTRAIIGSAGEAGEAG
jgi:uncharacterized protein (TIGR03083 family)